MATQIPTLEAAPGQEGAGAPKKKGKPWTETVLHRFGGGSDGGFPYDGLVQDPATGTIYGTTYGDTMLGDFGTVFGYTPDTFHTRWDETLHYSFTGEEGNGAFAEAVSR